jgi:FtsH-binding integral membrane protein
MITAMVICFVCMVIGAATDSDLATLAFIIFMILLGIKIISFINS